MLVRLVENCPENIVASSLGVFRLFVLLRLCFREDLYNRGKQRRVRIEKSQSDDIPLFKVFTNNDICQVMTQPYLHLNGFSPASITDETHLANSSTLPVRPALKNSLRVFTSSKKLFYAKPVRGNGTN